MSNAVTESFSVIAVPDPARLKSAFAFVCWLAGSAGLCGCAAEPPLLIEDTRYFEGEMPADFSGYWVRDYIRSDNVNEVLRNTYYELARSRPPNPNSGLRGPSERDVSTLMPLARLAELITRYDELTISQTDYEILVEREDDFALLCAFFDGVAKPTDSPFGREVCGWDDGRLISLQEMPDGLAVVHRFEVSEDSKQLRVITTVSSDTSRVPFTLSHYYWKIEKLPPTYECIETLSMKRVCSTGQLTP